MNCVPLIIIDVAYAASLIILFSAILRVILRGDRWYLLPFIIITACFIAGEYFTRSYPQHMGTAFYGIGNLVFMVTLVQIFGGRAARLSPLFMLIPALIIFTGYFWPERMRERDYFLVVNAAVISIYLGNAVILGMNRIQGRLVFAAIYLALALWMLGYAMMPLIIDQPGAEAFAYWGGGAKLVIALLQVMAGYRLHRHALRDAPRISSV